MEELIKLPSEVKQLFDKASPRELRNFLPWRAISICKIAMQYSKPWTEEYKKLYKEVYDYVDLSEDKVMIKQMELLNIQFKEARETLEMSDKEYFNYLNKTKNEKLIL